MVIDVVLRSFKCRRIIDNPLVDHTLYTTNTRRDNTNDRFYGLVCSYVWSRFYSYTYDDR